MKSKFVFFISIILVVCGFINLSCKHRPKKEQQAEYSKSNEDLEKEKVLKIAEKIAFKEYGNIIKSELPLKAQLVGDSIWVIEGTLAKGADGGTVYLELRKGDNKLLKITHYK